MSDHAEEMRLIIDRRHECLLEESSVPHETIECYLEQLSDGAWVDIDYDNRSRSNWTPNEALERVRELARAYLDPSHAFHTDDRLRTAATVALSYWVEYRPESDNWWYNDIGAPRIMRDILALMESWLDGATRDGALQVLSRTPVDGTGANLLWKADIAFMHACFSNDVDAATTTNNRAIEEVTVTTEEGIQPDYSFHQHGPLLQQYHYGSSFVTTAVSFASLVHDTEWEWPVEKRNLVGNLVLEGHRWMQRGGIAIPSTLDRALSRPGAMELDAAAYQRLADLVEDRADELAMFADHVRNGVPAESPSVIGHRHFWRSDMTVHHRPMWSVSLKIASDRTRNTESINDENLLGRYLTAGALFATVAGDEYLGLMPVWDWTQVPGVTGYANWVVEPAQRSFAGGIAHGTTGVDVLEYATDRGSLQAMKAWCFGKDAVVCLGAGITASDGPVQTTIDQRRLRGSVTVHTGETSRSFSASDGEHLPASRIDHDGLCYQFPSLTTVHLTAGDHSGNWSRINKAYDESARAPVFTARIDHGDCPSQASYAYAIGPTTDVPPQFDVLANNPSMQAVAFPNDLLHAVVYEAGTYELGDHTLTTDTPCLIQRTSDALTIGNPAHRNGRIALELDEMACTTVIPDDPTEPPQDTHDLT